MFLRFVVVQELKEAFLMLPVRTDMRFKQSSKGELIISVTVVYATGITQHFEGAGDADLISAIHFDLMFLRFVVVQTVYYFSQTTSSRTE